MNNNPNYIASSHLDSSFAIGVMADILKAFESIGEEAAGCPERVD